MAFTVNACSSGGIQISSYDVSYFGGERHFFDIFSIEDYYIGPSAQLAGTSVHVARWLLFAPAIVLALLGLIDGIRRPTSTPITHCPKCDYDLRGSLGSAVCPECGTEISDDHRQAMDRAVGKGISDTSN